MLNIDEIKAREQKATPGPWKVGNGSKKCGFNGANVIVAIKSNQPYVVMDRAIYPKETKFNKQVLADMKFAARARTDIPALLSEVEWLAKKKDLAEKMLLHYRRVAENADQQIATLKKALEMAANRLPGERCKVKCPDDEDCVKCYIHQAQQLMHETHEAHGKDENL